MSRFQTIVAALDFSGSAADALDAAVAIAAADAGSRIHLLHVVPSPIPALWTDDVPPLDARAVEQASTDAAREQLAALAASRALAAGRVATAVTIGSAPAEIVRYAGEQAADVIVLGSHGHGLVRRLLLGSVADTVVRQSPCAVLVVPRRTLRGAAPSPPADTPALP